MCVTRNHAPLTATSSLGELIMADTNLKPRRARGEHATRISVALEADSTSEHGRRTAFPWMQVTNAMLEHAGFLPGNQVLFSIDYRHGHITITPDYDYRVAGRYMTATEANAMLQRRSKRN
jgi:toxic protein SymE